MKSLLVLLLLLIGGGLTMLALIWLLQRVLPRSWPPGKRWGVAVVTAPSMAFLVILLLSGSGFLQAQLSQWLLP